MCIQKITRSIISAAYEDGANIKHEFPHSKDLKIPILLSTC